MTAQHAVEEIRNDLMRIGLFCPVQEVSGDKGDFTAEIKFGGGRFGKDIDGSDINDDGISHKVEGGLSLEIQHEVTSGGTHFIKTKIV